MDEHIPDPQTSGALTPPPRHPPTALATSAPLPPREPSASRFPARSKGIRGLVNAALDRLDALADQIADAVGLR